MMDHKELDPHQAVDFIIRNAKHLAKAKSERIFLEEWRKSQKALLMKSSKEETIGAQEREAYAHPKYHEVLEGIRAAVETEEELRWKMVAAQARIELWRSQEASNRIQDKATQ